MIEDWHWITFIKKRDNDEWKSTFFCQDKENWEIDDYERGALEPAMSMSYTSTFFFEKTTSKGISRRIGL